MVLVCTTFCDTLIDLTYICDTVPLYKRAFPLVLFFFGGSESMTPSKHEHQRQKLMAINVINAVCFEEKKNITNRCLGIIY